MVGIISHDGLGLFDSSMDRLGVPHGEPTSLGQAKGSSNVNIATGNLSIQFLDESLSGTGADLFALRTYNSMGTLTDGDADGWRWVGEKKIVLNSGSAGAPNSSVKRTLGDGSETFFNWDTNKGLYVSTDGSGAHDVMSWSAGTNEWIVREDGSNVEERYNGTTGWIKNLRDASGNGFDYTFSGSKLTNIKDIQSGQELILNYGTNGKMVRIDTKILNAGNLVTVKQVIFDYDTTGRLTAVKTDLTPADNSIADNNIYSTNYTYVDETSRRIASISQSDGTSASFEYYTETDGVTLKDKIKSVTDQTGTTTFTYNTNSTTVKNSLNDTWTYTYDATTKQLKTVSNSAGQVSSYNYDANGNVASVTNGTGNTITYTYDDSDSDPLKRKGNRIKEVDTLGNTITRTFGDLNQLLTETRYSVASTTSPGGAETTRYVYDTSNRLKFVVTQEGRITENFYNTLGLLTLVRQYAAKPFNLTVTPAPTLTDLTNWAAALTATEKPLQQLTEFVYDYRGNLEKKTSYAVVNSSGVGVLDNAADVTQYSYDEYGRLLHTITSRTTSDKFTAYTYDGMGRQLSVINGAGTTTTVYSGVNITVTNAASGLKTVSTTDNRGRITSLTQSLTDNSNSRTTKYYYNTAGQLRMTEDSTGARSYLFYDAAGRISARVDATGAAIAYTYNRNNQVLTETRYTNTVSTSTWFDNTKPENEKVVKASLVVNIAGTAGIDIATDATNDRKTTNAYYESGLLRATAVDGTSTINYTYDGASRLIKTLQSGRLTKYYYDKDGRQRGVLNAERNFTEMVYDSVGRLIKTIRYDGQVSTINQALEVAQDPETFNKVKADVAANVTLSSYFYYDAEGRQVGVVNEQGFLTETVYDAVNNQRKIIQYKTPVTVLSDSSLTSLRSSAGASNTTTIQFDKFGREETVTTQDATVSRNVYDAAGRLSISILAEGTSNHRASAIRYNAFGETINIVSGTNLTKTSTQTEINTAITNYGTTYQIDAVGRKVAVLGPVEAGKPQAKTFLFYNTVGQLTYTVNALGEVSKTTYNSFGQVSEVRVYTERLSAANLANITTGGLDTNISGKVVVGADTIMTTTYNKLGLVHTQTDAQGFVTTNTYTGYGQLFDSFRTISSGVTTRGVFTYDLLGRLRDSYSDYDGLRARTTVNYDGLGRVSQTIDANRRATNTTYEENGRTIIVKDPLTRSSKIKVDFLGRTLESYDGFDKVTSYVYDDINRKITVTTPENISISTWKTRTGETLQMQDGKGQNTTYTYTKDGQLDTVKNHDNVVITKNYYDNSDRLYESVDANGTITRYTYDAANRVIEKAIDPAGLNLRTKYEFDGQGRQIFVTEGFGTAEAQKIEYKYNLKGQISDIIVDPDALGLKTKFFYDGVGQTTRVEKSSSASPSPQITVYEFDKLGRKTREIIDPNENGSTNKLNIITDYKYDANGNLTRVIDDNEKSAWFVYNNAGDKTHQIDALGGVTLYEYDKNGKLHHTRQFVNTISTTGLGDVVTSITLPAVDSNDRRTYSVYDDNGRLEYTLNAVSATEWAVSQYVYDANGNVTEVWAYDKYITGANITSITATGSTQGVLIIASEVASLITGLGYSASVSLKARVTKYEYDVNNRKITEIVGAVSGGINSTTRFKYDASGNLTRKIIDANNSSTWFVYDKAGRLTRQVDALGGVTAYDYLANGALHHTRQYISPISTSSLGDVVTSITLPGASTSDRRNYTVNDSAGRAKYSLSAANATEWIVSENSYDAFGNIVEVRAYDKPLTEANVTSMTAAGSTGGASVVVAEVSALLTSLGYSVTATGNARVTKYEYDASNRKTAEILDATTGGENIKTSFFYDGVGNLTRVIHVPTNSSTWYVYDAIGQKTYEINTFGEVTSFEYDGLGNPHHTRRHVNTTSTNSLGNVVTNFSAPAIHAEDRRSYTIYDIAGRLRYSLSAMNATEWIVSENTHDALGNVRSIIAYDKTLQESQIATVAPSGAGKEVTQAEIATLIAAIPDNSNSRITVYDYDVAGRQIKTTLPGFYDISDGRVYATVGSETDRFERTIDVTYDAIGNAVVNKIRIGKGSTTQDFIIQYKTYDALGREVHDIDGEGYVTQKKYDALGNLDKVVRSANRFTATLPAGQYWWLVSDVGNQTGREMDYDYDRLGRQTKITQPSTSTNYVGGVLVSSLAAETTFVYDTFGNVKKQSVKIDTTTSRADTYYYYDKLGREVWSVDAEGYGTETFYNSRGNVNKVTEYFSKGTGTLNSLATPRTYTPDAQKRDRITEYTYDSLGRIKTISRRLNNEVASTIVDTKSYNSFGEAKESIDVFGNVTAMQYNRVGQLVTLTEPTRKTAAVVDINNSLTLDVFKTQVNASPVTTFTYNAFGENTKEVRSAGGGRGATITIQHVRDLAGNEYQTQDANGNWSSSAYDIRGKVIRQTQSISVTNATSDINYSHTIERRFAYDRAGRLTSTVDVFNDQQSGQYNKYNGYGEITEEYKVWGIASSSIQSLMSSENNNAIVNSYFYDGAGRIEYKRSSDGYTYYYYNLMDNLTRMVQRGTTDAIEGARVSETSYNLLGHLKEQKLPGFSATTAAGSLNTSFVIPVLKQTTDRWGNVLTRTDATDQNSFYSYDQDNRLISEVGPAESVLNLDLTTKTSVLEHKWIYDKGGRLVEDQFNTWNGAVPYGSPVGTHATKNVYDNVGQLIETTDATGVKQFYSYDAYGNRVGAKNGLGHIMVDDFNAEGKITKHSILRINTTGEYTGSQSGTLTAVALASYEYDQAGRRYSEADALGNKQYYKFDERNNIVIERGRAGAKTFYKYDALGHKVEESKEQSVDGVTTIKVLNEWIYTVPGTGGSGFDFKAYGADQLQKRDVDGVGGSFYYTYTRFGELEKEGRGLLSDSIEYTYWENGLQKAIKALKYEDVPANVYSGAHIKDEQNHLTYYYDIKANKTASDTWQKFYRGAHTAYGGVFNPLIDETSSLTTFYLHDNLNRLKEVRSPVGDLYFQAGDISKNTTQVHYLTYNYDEWGNRRRISTGYKLPGDYTPGISTKEEWYSYDDAGRVAIEAGDLINGVITVSAGKGTYYTYDNLTGRRETQQKFKGNARASYWVGMNHIQDTFARDYLMTSFLYNDVGLVKESAESIIRRNMGANVFAAAQDTSVTINWKNQGATVSTYKLMREVNKYDNRGFKIEVNQNNVTGLYSTNVPDPAKKIVSSYTLDGSLATQATSYFSLNDSAYRLETDIDYVYNPDGNVKLFTYRSYDKDKAPGTVKFTNTYKYSYLNTYLGRQLQSVSVTSDLDNTGVGTTFNLYDVRGHLIRSSITEAKVGDSSKTGRTYRYFNSDATGQIIARAEIKYGNSDYEVQSYYYSSTSGELANYGNKEINISPLSAVNQGGNTPGEYKINAGDSLMGIAQALFGDSKLWYLIADANALTMGPTEQFLSENDVDRILVIPNVDKNIANTSVNWKPYNPTEVIGDLTPTVTIIPPSDKGCDAFARIIGLIVQIIVTVVVTIYAGPEAGQAAGAAAGNYATQYSSLMLNGEFDWERWAKYTFIPMYGNPKDRLLMMADPLSPGAKGKIDYESIAISAAAGYVGGSVSGYAADAGKFVSGFAGGAATYATNYGLNRLAGNKPSFDLRAMATAAVAQGIIKSIGPTALPAEAGSTLSWGAFDWSEMAREALVSVRSAAINYAVGKSFDPENTHWDTAIVLADAFGNAMGTGIVKMNSTKAKAESDQPDVNEKDWEPVLPEDALEKLSASYDPLSENLGMDSLNENADAQNESVRQNAERKNDEKMSAINKARTESALKAEGEYIEAAEIYAEELTPIVEEMTLTNQKNETDVKQIYETNYNSSNRQALAEASAAWYNDSNRVEARRIGEYSAWREPQIERFEAQFGKPSNTTAGQVGDVVTALSGGAARFGVETIGDIINLAQIGLTQGLSLMSSEPMLGTKLKNFAMNSADNAEPGMFVGGYRDERMNAGINGAAMIVGGAAALDNLGMSAVEKAAVLVPRKATNNIDDIARTSGSVTGAQWNEFLSSKYGAENVFWDWPKNQGFVYGADEIGSLQPGQLLGRLGSEKGTFVSPLGTAPETLSLRPGTDLSNLNVYRVTQEIPNTRIGPAAPAFDMPGYGPQFELSDSVKELLRSGHLERVVK